MTAHDLIDRADQLGLRLEPRGDRLAVVPGSRLPPDFAETLRQHKPAILALLEAKAANLPPDCVPWLHIAKQILAGEFAGADKATVESLTIGLRGISNPWCQQALARLPRNPQKSATE